MEKKEINSKDKRRKTLYLHREIAKELKILSAEKEISESDVVSRLIKREVFAKGEKGTNN